MSKSQNRRINIYINGQAVQNDISSIRKEAAKLTNQLSHMERGTKEYRQQAAKIKQLNSIVAEHNKGLRSTTSTLGSMKTAWLGIAAAVAGAYRAIRSLSAAYDSRTKANQTLLFALNGQEAVQRRLIRQADEMQRLHGIDDDTIKSQMAFLALQGRSESQITRTMNAAFQLSRVMGISFSDAVRQLDGTLEGNIGRLSRLDSGFKDLTTEQLRNGAAVDLINKKYTGLSEKSFQEGLGPLRRFTNAMGDLRKTLGELVFGGLMPLYTRFAEAIERVNASISATMTTANQRFSDQSEKVADLVVTMEPLLIRYDDLTAKSNLSATEQDELNSIIETITGNLPSAANKFDQYGNAISISTDRVREHINQQKELLQYVNAQAIRATQEDIAKTTKEIENLEPIIKEIEETGTFQRLDRFFDANIQDWVTDYRDAPKTIVDATIEQYRRLLSERRGMQTHLDQLTGASIDQLIEERKIRQLYDFQNSFIEGFGDGSGIQEVQNAYQALTKKIADAREQMQGFVAAGKFDEAKQTGQGIQALEAQKMVLDGIIKSGGDVLKFLDDLTDAETGLLEETSNFYKKFSEDFSGIFDEIAEKREAAKQEELDRDQRRREFELEKEKELADQRIELERQVAANKRQITDAALQQSFWLLSQYIDNGYQRQLTSLRLSRDAELGTANLTAEQKEAIDEKYRKKEAAAKTQAFKRQRAADIIQSAINGFLAVSRALQAPPGWPLNAPNVVTAGILAAIQTGGIAAQPVPQFARGKYDVIGDDDNRHYRASFRHNRTGIVRRPSLIAELGPEMIIDAQTLTRLRPEVLAEIQAARHPSYPRHTTAPAATGQAQPATSDPALMQTITTLNQVISDLNKHVATGIRTKFVFQEFREFAEKVDSAYSENNL